MFDFFIYLLYTNSHKNFSGKTNEHCKFKMPRMRYHYSQVPFLGTTHKKGKEMISNRLPKGCFLTIVKAGLEDSCTLFRIS